jgi:hypothetical protein
MDEKYRDRALTGAYRITMPAMVLALTLLFVYLSTIVPTARLAFYFLSSIFIVMLMVEKEPWLALIVFIGVSLLGFLVVSDKMRMIPYVLFFGHFGIVKYYIEKVKNPVLRWGAKLAYFNAAIIAAYFIVKSLILPEIPLPDWALLLIAQPVFVVFDILYSMAGNFYYRSIRRFLFRQKRR